jgi:hypothetical protein
MPVYKMPSSSQLSHRSNYTERENSNNRMTPTNEQNKLQMPPMNLMLDKLETLDYQSTATSKFSVEEPYHEAPNK